MRAQLIGRTGAAAGLTFRVSAAARIGRDPANEVNMPLKGLSRLHAAISFDAGSFWIEDKGSTNGTSLNGRAIQKERLQHLDVVTLSEDVELLFLVRESAEPSGVTVREGIVKASLVSLDGPEAGSSRDIPKGVLTIGRASSCNVLVESPTVSKTHARIERLLDGLVVTDDGSSNGTFVNGVRITTAPLVHGDRVQFGSRQFRVEIEYGKVTGLAPATPTVSEKPSGERSQIRELSTKWRQRYEFTPGETKRDEVEGINATALSPAPDPEARKPADAQIELALVKPTRRPRTGSGFEEAPKANAAPAAVEIPPAPVTEPAPRPPGLELILTGETGATKMGRGLHTIGRVDSCSIPIKQGKMSRHHATIEVTEGAAILKDLGSANGTFVNGRRIDVPTTLADGDTIAFADTEFRVTLRRPG